MRILICLFLGLLAPLSLRAEVIVGASLEWLADTSAAIAIYHVTKAGPAGSPDLKLDFAMDEGLKGTPSRTLSGVAFWERSTDRALTKAVAEEDKFLVFLKTDDKEVLRVAHLINLSSPLNGAFESVAINHRFERLADPDKIVSTVKERLKAHPGGKLMHWQQYPDNRFDVEVPHGSPAHKVLFAGSTCYLLVPEDLKTKR